MAMTTEQANELRLIAVKLCALLPQITPARNAALGVSVGEWAGKGVFSLSADGVRIHSSGDDPIAVAYDFNKKVAPQHRAADLRKQAEKLVEQAAQLEAEAA